MSNLDSIYYHAFCLLPQIGPRRLAKIIRFFGSAQKAWLAEQKEWKKEIFENAIIEAIFLNKNQINLEKEKERLENLDIHLLNFTEEVYPSLLKEIPDPPPLLYYKGHLPPQNSLNISIVGTRKITSYGTLVTEKIAGDLAKVGVVVVSGLAFGVDATAHKAVLKNQGVTVAVLGGGLDDQSLYPKEHTLLAQEILDRKGCLVSEYPPKTPALKGNFIARDRIMSGLASGVVVVECGVKSGSLITANFALEQNRLVFAIPGPITSPASEGPNRLIRQGARAVLDTQDILSELNISPDTYAQKQIAKALPNLTSQEKIILELLSQEPKYPDELVRDSGLSPSQTASALGLLELKSLARNLGGNQYVKNG